MMAHFWAYGKLGRRGLAGRRGAVGAIIPDLAGGGVASWQSPGGGFRVRVVGFVGEVRSALPAVAWLVPVGRVSPTAGGVTQELCAAEFGDRSAGGFQVPYLNGAPRVLASPVAPRDCSVESGGISPAGPVAILMLTWGGRGSRWERLGRWQSGTGGGVMAGVVTGVVDGVRYGWWLNPIAGYYGV